MSKRKVVAVEWEDCRMLSQHNVYNESEIPGAVIGVTVGWLIKENDSFVAVGLERFGKELGQPSCNFRHVTVLPRCQIRKVDILAELDED